MKCIDDEIPFEIPKSWEWSRLGDICSYLHRGKSPKYGEHKFLPIIAQKCNQWDKIYTDRCLFSSKDYIEKYKEEQFVQKGDIIINSTGGGTVGRTGYIDSYVFANFDRFVVDSHVTLVRSIYPIASKYVYYFLISPLIQIGLEDRCSGSTNQIELGTTTITSYLVPIPPIKEQYRIIDQFQKVLPLLERYSTNQIAQDKLNAEINIQLKKSILQEAIHGKLVPQITEEGTAKELLAEIRKEKEHLAKEGKLKKFALTDSIIYKGDDNKYYEQIGRKCLDITELIPFEIPENWVWTKMGQIGDWGAGSTPQRGNANYYNGNILWLKTGELNNEIVYDTEEKITPKALQDCSLRINKIGDVLIAMYGATIGKLAIVGKELTTNQACCGCTPYLIYNWYLFYFLMASRDSFIKKGEGGAQPNISRVKLIEYLIPLPPLKEQYRIVAQIEKLFEQLR
ncbi:restriction endonuclease subunit S [Bacteroides xylanisolvens]|uniref:restriction endonuclease subunit S n=1 Tax=Bacteroides xylanisolvens TaxID=371601 RepID=UPI00189930C6|nr:restriction endonuclease subunit S [Bacteroides xylanisolvens]